MPVVGQAEIVNVNGKPWKRAERVDHLCLWHGKIPQARVWLYAPAWAEADFWTACAVGEHELYHFAHKKNKSGELMYDDDKNSRPMLAARAHDVGEFVGVMQRYGVSACGGRSREFVEAALSRPLIAPSDWSPPPTTCGCGGRIT